MDTPAKTPKELAEMAEIAELAQDDANRAELYGSSRNVFSTHGARAMWQNGYDGIRPPSMVDHSGEWRQWYRGVKAREIDNLT